VGQRKRNPRRERWRLGLHSVEYQTCCTLQPHRKVPRPIYSDAIRWVSLGRNLEADLEGVTYVYYYANYPSLDTLTENTPPSMLELNYYLRGPVPGELNDMDFRP